MNKHGPHCCCSHCLAKAPEPSAWTIELASSMVRPKLTGDTARAVELKVQLRAANGRVAELEADLDRARAREKLRDAYARRWKGLARQLRARAKLRDVYARRWKGLARQLRAPRDVVHEIRKIVQSMGAARIVAVERVDQVNARTGFGSIMATGLCLAHGVGQRIVQALEDDGTRVVEVTAETWHLAYFARRAVDKQAVKALVQSRIAGWPRTSNSTPSAAPPTPAPAPKSEAA